MAHTNPPNSASQKNEEDRLNQSPTQELTDQNHRLKYSKRHEQSAEAQEHDVKE